MRKPSSCESEGEHRAQFRVWMKNGEPKTVSSTFNCFVPMIDWERRWRKFENGDEPICICEEAARQMGIVRQFPSLSESPEAKHKARSAIRDEDAVREQKAGTQKKEKTFSGVDPAEEKMRRTFHIFVNAGGQAHYVEAVENLAAARKRLKQVAQNASGDCFLYSVQDGIVEFIVRPELPERLQKAPKLHVVQGRRASQQIPRKA